MADEAKTPQEHNGDLYRRAMAAAGAGAWSIDLASRQVALCATASALLAAPPSPLAADAFLGLIHQDDRAAAASAWFDPAEDGSRIDFDFRTAAPAAAAWLRARGLVCRAPGHPPVACGILADITDRKQKDATTTRVAAIVASTDDAVIGETLDGIVTDWNPAAAAMFGYSAAEMIGQPIAVLHPPSEQSEFDDILARLRRGERIDRHETRRIRKDGTVIDVMLTVSPIHAPDGRIIGASKIARDITAAKRSEALRAGREALLSSVLETAPDAIIMIDGVGRIQSFSTMAERMFGYTAAETIGRNVNMLMPGPHSEQHDRYLARYRESGVRHIIGIGRVVAGRRRDGSQFPMELAVGEVRSEDSQFFTGFVRDLTERNATQRRLDELQTELTHLSRLSAMGEMASTLAHELNQPLTAAASYLSGVRRLLADKTDESSVMVRGAVERAADQALRAGQIIRRLRSFVARGESEQQPENLSRLIEDATALGLLGAREAGVEVRLVFDPSLRFVMVDRIQVQQVLVNLIRNAVEAMQDSPRRELVIRTTRGAGSDEEQDMAVVSVSDTGPGISPGIEKQLFQPFVTTKPNGMGVGLSISHTIMQAHGGRLWAEPNPPGGAVFLLSMKLCAEGAPRVG